MGWWLRGVWWRGYGVWLGWVGVVGSGVAVGGVALPTPASLDFLS